MSTVSQQVPSVPIPPLKKRGRVRREALDPVVKYFLDVVIIPALVEEYLQSSQGQTPVLTHV